MSRYQRQMLLPDVGTVGQDRLARATVAIIGAGGLGAPVLQYLTGAGVGTMILIDPDCVEESNLHRQTLFRMRDIGRPKAQVAAEAMQALNPEVDIEVRIEPLTPQKAPDVVASADVIIDAADSFAVSYTLSDSCLSVGTPLISASVLGQSGYVGGFCGPAPSLRAVFPELPTTGATCATAGVLGPVVGTIGTLQAQMALRILLASKPSPLGRMVTVDLERFDFGGFDFMGSAEPELAFPFLAQSMLRSDDLVIDLRTKTEAPAPVTPTALRLDQDSAASLAPTEAHRIVLCCRSGLRAWRAASALHQRGFTNLALLAEQAST